MEPWRDCAPCHPLSDGGAGKRYANLILINRPDQDLLNSRRMDRRRFPTASGPSVGAPHPCRWIASGLSEAPSTRNPPRSSRPPFHSVPLQHCHNMLRWIRVKLYPHLPSVSVSTTSAQDYMKLLREKAS